MWFRQNVNKQYTSTFRLIRVQFYHHGFMLKNLKFLLKLVHEQN